MNALRALWDKIRPAAVKELMAKEPAIIAGVTALAVSIGAHYGLTLTATQQAYVSGGTLFLLNFVVRQVVTPSSPAAVATPPKKAARTRTR